MTHAPLALFAQILLACVAGAQSPDESIERLKHADAEVRRLAAQALGKQKAEAAIPSLVELLKDPEQKVRTAASVALLRIGAEAMPALAGGLRFPQPHQRRTVAAALHRLAELGKRNATKEALTALVAALKDEDIDVRIYSALTLGLLGAEARSTLPALFDAAGDTSNVGAVLRQSLPSGVGESAIKAALTIDLECAPQLAKAALPKLIAALKSEDMAVLQAAGYALSNLGPDAKPAVPGLLEAQKRATGFAEGAFRSALISIGGEALKPLFDTVRDPKTPLEKRRRTLFDLSWMAKDGDEVAAAAFTELLRDSEPEIRASAADAVGRVGTNSKAALQGLMDLLGDEKLEQAALRIRRGDGDVIPKALSGFGKDAVPGLARTLKDKEKRVLARFQAARALVLMGRKAKEALPDLEAGMEDRLAVVALESACAYVRAGGDGTKALPLLRQGLKHPAPFIVWNAAYSIERLGALAREAVPDLKSLLEHEDSEVRIVAARALSKMGAAARPAVAAMGELLKSDDGRQQYQVEHALEKLGPDARPALPALIGRLKSLNEMRPHPVLLTIGNFGPEGKDAVPALLVLLNRKDSIMTDDVIQTLGRIGPGAKVAVPQLVKLLENKDWSSRGAAARSLGQIGPEAKEAVPMLTNRLSDKDLGVRVWAAFALARITGETKPHLARMLELWEDVEGEGPFTGSTHHNLVEAFELLGKDSRPALDLLLAAVMDMRTSAGTHRKAARTLGQMREDADKIVPQLIRLIERKGSGYERNYRCEHAAEALGLLGKKAEAAVSVLRKLQEDRDNTVAEAASRALAKIRDK